MAPVNPAKAFLAHLAKVANMREFAKKVGVSEVTFSRWKNGDEPPNPKLETLIKIARTLHVQVADLLDEEREPDLASFSKVPVSRGSIGAGPARLDDEPNEDDEMIAFKASFIRRFVRFFPLRVGGDKIPRVVALVRSPGTDPEFLKCSDPACMPVKKAK